jgi:hypothetical protein
MPSLRLMISWSKKATHCPIAKIYINYHLIFQPSLLILLAVSLCSVEGKFFGPSQPRCRHIYETIYTQVCETNYVEHCETVYTTQYETKYDQICNTGKLIQYVSPIWTSYGGSISGSRQFSLLPKLPQNLMLNTKRIKHDS